MKLAIAALTLLIGSYSFFGTALEPDVRLDNSRTGVYTLTITPRHTFEILAAKNNWNEEAEATCALGKPKVEYLSSNLSFKGDAYEKDPVSGELVAEVIPASVYGEFTCVSR